MVGSTVSKCASILLSCRLGAASLQGKAILRFWKEFDAEYLQHLVDGIDLARAGLVHNFPVSTRYSRSGQPVYARSVALLNPSTTAGNLIPSFATHSLPTRLRSSSLFGSACSTWPFTLSGSCQNVAGVRLADVN
jgi:hypothetical protein